MRALIAMLLVVTTSGCFPESARHRRYANIAEGVGLVGGIVLQYVAKSDDCGARRPGTVVMDCDRSVAQLDNLGLVLIFASLVGFAATTMSGQQGFVEQTTDTPATETPEDTLGAWQAPQSFCPAMWAGNVRMAEAALVTYLKSVGAVSTVTANEALHAWLSRQECVTIEELDPTLQRIDIRVTSRSTRYSIDISASPFVVLIANGTGEP